jgi:hypothetical protein
LTLSSPPLETIAGPGDSPALARLANDELQRICAVRSDKFPDWVASLPLNNVEASLAEIDRAVAAGARGIQIFTNFDGPLDDPEFFPIFEHARTRNHLAVWMHPARDARFADFGRSRDLRGETRWQESHDRFRHLDTDMVLAPSEISFNSLLGRSDHGGECAMS